jgi:hypothetical protein
MALLLTPVGGCAPYLDEDAADSEAVITVPDLMGVIDVRTIDHAEGGSAHEYSVAFDDTQRVLLVFDTDPELRPGTELEIWGEWEDDSRIIVRDFRLASIPKRLDSPLSRKPMHHRVAVLATSGASVTEAHAARQMEEASRYFAETTRGFDTFSMSVFRRYDVALSSTDCQYSNSATIANRLIDAFKRDGFDPANYEHIATIVPRSCGSDWTGAWAYVGAVRDDGSLRFQQISMYKDNVVDPWYFAHELGHNLGMDHAQAATCSGGLYKASLQGCSISEYGDYNDVMGNGEGVYWNGAHQRFFGWIAPQRVVTVGGNGTFNLIPVDAKQGCGVQALRIPVPNESAKYFYVEYRKARSDSAYAGTGNWGGSRGDTVLITRSQDGLTNQSSTQRLELGTSRYLGAQVGRRYDLGGGVSVEVRSMGAQAAQVVVQAPAGKPHRDDAGGSVATLSYGSVGVASCSAPAPDADGCPNDPNKTAPGICGCGAADTDRDLDGTADCRDGCPLDAKKLAPGVCGCGVPEGSCGSTTVSLRVEDAFIDSARRSQNFGAVTGLEVDNSPSEKRALLKPRGLTNIPRGARVESAQLVIQTFDGGHSMSAHKLTRAWSQSNVTYSNAPTASSAFASVSGATGTKVIDVTSIVQAWVNGEAAHGIGLYPTGANGVDFYSAEHSVSQNQPSFRITYRSGN